MRASFGTAMFVLGAMVMLPGRAAAQPEPRWAIGVGYSALHDDRSTISFPVGWVVDAARHATPWLSVVAEGAGHYRTISGSGGNLTFSLHTLSGGLRGSVRVGRLTEFGQVLGGIVIGTGSAFNVTQTTRVFGVTGGVGFHFAVAARLALRAQVDYRATLSAMDIHSGHEIRFVSGIVVGSR